MRAQRGFVLVNALLIVAALAVVALVLLSRAQAGRTRLALGQEWMQTDLYLDGFDALALTVLDRDLRGPALDSLEDEWAATALNVELDRGRVAGRIVDLQGRYSLNRLTGSGSGEMRAEFLALAEAVGLSVAQAEAVADFLGTDGTPPLAGYGGRPIPIHPRGGTLVAIDQLRAVPGMTPDALARLAQVAAAAPDVAINVNTAPAAVLMAVLPQVPAAAIREVLSNRARDPYPSVEAFLLTIGQASDADPDSVDETRFSVESNWFMVEASATLGDTILSRHTVIRRAGAERRARVEYRIRSRE
ncbi:type II secretion system minor pseudopilin GspK [Ruegeria marina]|uniref:Type II secretion system protein K n=1 Tax=Ruegeria marina TaxID=639004 RepID=A0A1G7CDI8_9RHOB|nr:type II secretion system minor pseudopilin GspK [Ruegeria marina]SDE37432.1 Type II secretory pathway, component PulK [Ruegeria marina]